MEGDILKCKNQLKHGDKWLLLTTNEKIKIVPCFACCILCLEEEQQINVRKKVILSYFIEILNSNFQIIIDVITDNEVAFHTIQVFLNLLSCRDEGLTKLTGECLLLFVIHWKKKELSLAVTQRLTVGIIEDCNYLRSLPLFHILGRIFHIFPELIHASDFNQFKLLHVLACGLEHPSDNVKSAILFLLRQIYCNRENDNASFRIVDNAFGKSILRILKCSQNKQLLKYSLGLLEVLLSKLPESLNFLFEIKSDDVTFTDVVKKILLSCEPSFQVCIIQCICQLLSTPIAEKVLSLLLEENISELLLEALSTKNEILLESIFCCLYMFVHQSTNSARYFVFGVGIIADVAFSLLDLRNWKLLHTALNLLTSIISYNQNLMASTQVTFLLQSIQLIEKTFKIYNPNLLLAAVRFFTEILKNEKLLRPFPMQQICRILNLCMEAQSRVISTSLLSDIIKKPIGSSESLPIELKLLNCCLDMFSSCIRIYSEYNQNPISVESGFVQPSIQKLNILSSQNEIQSQQLLLLCLSSVDEFFIPYCLKMKLTDMDKVTWYHLINVLSIILEEINDDILLFSVTKKLITAGFLKYLLELKHSKISFTDCKTEDVKNLCNNCIIGLLKSFLKRENYSETYLKALERGVIVLNDSVEDCASILSQRVEFDYLEISKSCVSSSQIAFLCLCYVSYLNEAFILNVKILIPHLIYFVTCNSNVLSACNVVFKQLIFIVAICTYQCVSKNMKYITELMEANIIIWDQLSKLKLPQQVYTHNKCLLWWCFRNKTLNSFSSSLLYSWLTFCIDEKNNLRHHAMNSVIHLLCCNPTAQKTFVLLFEFSSSENEILILFLKKVVKEISSMVILKKFLDLILLMIQHLHSFLVKTFILKSENHKETNDKVLCQGIECLLWCYEQLDHFEMHSKIIFHVSKYCFSSDLKEVDSIIACLKFLRFTMKHTKHCANVWHIITGDMNFCTFFLNCFSTNYDMEVEALGLLVILFRSQVNYDLKCNKYVQISANKVLKWLNSSRTQLLGHELFSIFIKSEFRREILILMPFKPQESISFRREQYLYYRLFSICLQNAIVLKNPFFQELVDDFLNFLNLIGKIDTFLVNHIMLQPWIKVLLESRLEILDSDTLKLFEKWLCFNEVNISLIGVMKQFARKILKLETLSEVHESCIHKLCTGVYSIYIQMEIKEDLRILISSCCKIRKEQNLVSKVENLVTEYLSNVSR